MFRGQRSYPASRGRFIPRGAAYYSTSTYTRGSADVVSLRDLEEGLGVRLQTISGPKPSEVSSDANFQNAETISSYDWIDGAGSPTIAVPGAPPVWQDRPLSYSVNLDQVASIKDNNGYRFPSSPLTPLIHAIQEYNPSFEFAGVDVVTDRRNIRRLMDWLALDDDDDSPSIRADIATVDNFRIDVQLADNRVLLFTRWEFREREDGPSGYSEEFVKASTRCLPGCGSDGTHHRIVSTTLGSTKILVRYLVQACLKDPNDASRRLVTQRTLPADDDLDELVSRTSGLSINSKHVSSRGFNRATRNQGAIQEERTLVVQSTPNPIISEDRFIKIKTRSARNVANFQWVKALGKVWLSDTSYVLLGIHDGTGTFTRLIRRAVDSGQLVDNGKEGEEGPSSSSTQTINDKLEKQQEKTRQVSARLEAFLRQLRDTLVDWSKGMKPEERPLFSLVFRDGKMALYRRKDDVRLPDELTDVFKWL